MVAYNVPADSKTCHDTYGDLRAAENMPLADLKPYTTESEQLIEQIDKTRLTSVRLANLMYMIQMTPAAVTRSSSSFWRRSITALDRKSVV